MKSLSIATALFLLSAGTARPDVFMFQTPSGNIVCSVGLGAASADVLCQIVERNGPPALPQPLACAATWGHEFMLFETGPTQMRCGNRPGRAPGVEVAPYGETGRFGDITCISTQQGFECRNRDGHGFFLSRARQTVF